MEPTSLSPTSLQVWSLCPARWVAEKYKRAETLSGAAADLGTTCHAALESFVGRVYVTGGYKNTLEHLLWCFAEAWDEKMRIPRDGPAWDDGNQMMENWHRRHDLSGRKIVSLETKSHFDIKTTKGIIPFNYIFDRLDLLDDGSVEVVDYKSSRARMSPSWLADRVQARCYGVAAQILYPDAPRVWVTFDMLRFDPVGTVFTREQNLATWSYIKRSAERIISTPEEHAITHPTVNEECRWCAIKHNCVALASNIEVGGILAMGDPLEAGKARAAATNRVNALKKAIEELDQVIVSAGQELDTDTWEDDEITVTIGWKGQRMVTGSDHVKAILGPELTSEYGSIGVTTIDKIMKDPRVAQEDKDMISGLVGYKKSDTPTVTAKAKNAID
jgi:hypothetical protein